MKSTLVFQKTQKIIEALLFVTREPLSASKLESILHLPEESIEQVLEHLVEEYENRGVKVLKVAHGYILGTNPECSEYVEHFKNFPIESRLSPQALETLAIIAYKQPVTRPEIERIRGVISDGVIDTLVTKKLIEEKGRSDAPGRPFIYATTNDFLKHFGIKDVADLPPLANIEEQETASNFDGILVEKEPIAEIDTSFLPLERNLDRDFPEETLEV